jgi:ribosomal protein S27E
MALQKMKCDVCGKTLMRDDWDGQYYQVDCRGLWNKTVVEYEDNDTLICSELCYNDKATSDYFKFKNEGTIIDTVYQMYKDGEGRR